MSKPAPIQISSEVAALGGRVWTVTDNGEPMARFLNGQAAIDHVHSELTAHERTRKHERNAAIAKAAMNILSRIAANQLNKKK